MNNILHHSTTETQLFISAVSTVHHQEPTVRFSRPLSSVALYTLCFRASF